MENNKQRKRLAIFQCHDKDGIIDDYIPYLLRDLLENLEMLVVVVNGKLTPEGRSKLEGLTSHIFVRADEGFDAAAWKDAMINYLGWEKVAEFDELILLNDTFFGPFYPFREVFEEMDQRPVDFWGLTAHAESIIYHDPSLYPHIPEHIQSYFIVIRKKMHTSFEFKRYWEQQPCYLTMNELIGYNELVFTKYFNDRGFTWDVLVNTKDLDGEYHNNVAVAHCWHSTYELIKNRKYPVLKRHSFGFDRSIPLNDSNGSQLRKTVDYIADYTNYDVTLIYRNVLRVYNIADIFNNLHLTYILPKRYSNQRLDCRYRAVMVFHIFYIDLLDYIYPYIVSLPECVDVILTTREENLNIVSRRFSPVLGSRLQVLSTKNRGRDLSALLVAAKNYLKGYDYIGFCHDKKSIQSGAITVGRDFQELIVENTIGSKSYVENVLDLFESHPELGFLSPPPPKHGVYLNVHFWGGGCIAQVRALAERLKLKTNISEEKMPLAIGTAFWCRRDALAPLLDYPWAYEDFPPEPLPADGMLSHGLERIFPFVAQHQGYLSGWVMTEDYASLEICNIHYRLDQVLFSSQTSIGVKGALVIYIKKHLPKPLWRIAKRIKCLLRW